MRLTSPAFQHGDAIPAKYTCDGQDMSPPLVVSNLSEQAKSLVLVVHDPDAPGKDWVHWLVWNIDPHVSAIDEGVVPIGVVEGQTDFGRTGWGGPCPPSGSHRYFFDCFSLDTRLDLTPEAARADVENTMADHILEQATLLGLYQRG